MNYYIITGTSRGIGEAIARKLITAGNTIFAVSRTMNEDLTELASSLNVPLFYSEADLSVAAEAEAFIKEVFLSIICKSLSLGMVIKVSTRSFKFSNPSSAIALL